MVVKKSETAGARSGTVVQFNLTGLLIYSVALMIAAALVFCGIGFFLSKPGLADRPQAGSLPITSPQVDGPSVATPPWGELMTSDIDIERPEEYAAFEINTNNAPAWVFEGKRPDEVASLLLACGLDSNRVARALYPGISAPAHDFVRLQPDNDLILTLTPENRARLYQELSRSGANHYMQFPFCFPTGAVEKLTGDKGLHENTRALIRQLLYPRGRAKCFSDFELLMRLLPSDQERLKATKALSRQSAVLARLRIRPDTDIDKLLGYWNRGVRVKDVRPLLESVKRKEDGGSISLLFLLPPLARERLYTFPMPSQPGDPVIDCHWSSLNFFSSTPDNHLGDPAHAVQFVRTNFYQVAAPTQYGDLVFLMDNHETAIHSAVYVAADIVFTKNGNNYSQPWMLMRLPDLLTTYAASDPPNMAVYRNKDW